MIKQFMFLKKWMIAPLFLFILFSCKKDKVENSPVIEKEFAFAGFNKINSSNTFNIIVSKGVVFQVKAKGPAAYLDDMEVNIINGQTLDIQYAPNYSNRKSVDVFITVPDLLQLTLAAAGKGEINGFANSNHVIRTVLSAGSSCVLNGAPVNVNFVLESGSQLEVNGTTANIYGSLSAGSQLNAYDLTSTEVDIEATSGSVAYVKVQDAIFAAASGGSKVYYKGNPVTKHFETSSGGQVIQE